MHRSAAPLLVGAFVWALASCGGGGGGPRSEYTLEEMRRGTNGGDAVARRDAALAELVAPGGDPAAGRRALESMRSSADPRVHYALAQTESAHGEFDRAADDLSRALAAARASHDPMAGAVAEVAVGQLVNLRGNVRDFDHYVVPVVDEIAQSPGALGPAAVAAVMDTATRWARERGLSDRAERWARAANCVTEWTVAGAFGPLPMLRFDERLPPEEPGPLAHDYDLGPGRGRRPTYTVHARGCAANLGSGRLEDGVFYAAADVVLERDADAVLYVNSPNVFTAFVDATPVVTLDARARSTPLGAAVPVHLLAGRHTLRVKIATRVSSPLLIAGLLSPEGVPVGTLAPARAGAFAFAPAAGPPLPQPGEQSAPVAGDPFSRFLAAELLFARQDAVAAREMLRPLAAPERPGAPAAQPAPGEHTPAGDAGPATPAPASGPRATPMLLTAWGTILMSDPFASRERARNAARGAFEAVAARDPDDYYARLVLARLAAGEGRADDALAMTRQAFARFPDNPEVLDELAARLLDRNWDGEAGAVVARALELFPDACWPVQLQMQLAQRHANNNVVRAAADRITRCDALNDAAALTALDQRRWGEAEREYQRLLAGDPEGRAYRRALVGVMRERGDLEQAERAGRALLAENPEDTGLRADLVDLDLALGQPERALEMLDAEIARAPGPMAELFRYRAALARREEIAPWRLDGREVLREFDAANHHYDAAAVLVLDYTVRRVMPDGSALELTHNIIRVQTQEGVDENATTNLPQGAMVLTLRTHKADGRVLEPDAIDRLDAIAFPDVHIGDAVEFEYVRALPANDLAPGGFAGDRFYFQSFDIPYDHSEWVVVMPKEMADRLVVDPRGPAPRTVRRDIGNALTEFRWGVRQSQRTSAEPQSVAAREFVPSVNVGVGATWERYVDALVDRLADTGQYDPASARLAEQIVGNAATASEKLRRLHRWVIENVDQEGSGTLFANAASMVSARSGHRTRVLCYLLELSHVPCKTVLVRPLGNDATPSELADDGTYTQILLQVGTEAGERWVTAADRGAPLDWVPPPLAGQPGLVLAPGAPRVQVPALDPARHRREITVRMTLDARGAARAEVTERLKGQWAVSWRETLRQIDPANLEREFESYVNRQVTGASLSSLQIEGPDDPDADIVVRYAFTAPNVATATAGGLVFEGIYTARLGAVFAQLPQRRTTLYNPDAANALLDLTVTLPAGARLADLPPTRDGSAPGLQWRTQFERTADGFRYVRTVRMPPGRITPEQYPAFSAQVRELDTQDTQRVRVALH